MIERVTYENRMRALGIQALEGARMKWFHRPDSHGTLAIRRDRARLKECLISSRIPNADHMPRMTAAFDMRSPNVPSRSFPTAHLKIACVPLSHSSPQWLKMMKVPVAVP